MLNLFTKKTKKFLMTTVLFLTTFVVYSNPPENPPSEKTTVSGKVLDDGWICSAYSAESDLSATV